MNGESYPPIFLFRFACVWMGFGQGRGVSEEMAQ